jgi:hypothetical protein
MIKNCLLLFLLFSVYIISLSASIAQAAVTILDNFNRSDDPINGPWTIQNGTFNIINNAVQGGDYAIATFNGKSSTILEADVEATGSGVQYVALVLGYRDLNNNYFIKAQDDDGGTPDFNRLYCYYGNNHPLPIWFNDPISLSPSFTSAHMRVEYNPSTNNITITFSNIDGGSGTQQYICADAPLTGGNGIGIGSFNISRGKLDNFIADLNPVATIPSLTEWGMIIFVVLAGLGSVYYLRRRRSA